MPAFQFAIYVWAFFNLLGLGVVLITVAWRLANDSPAKVRDGAHQ
ncbi:hypothetical protein [Sagittula sp. NFXS13]